MRGMKEKLTQYKNQAEAHCRELFDRLETLRAQATQIEVELERSRGDYRTYDKLLVELTKEENGEAVLPPLAPSAFTPPHPMFPVKSPEEAAKLSDSKPSKKKEETHV